MKIELTVDYIEILLESLKHSKQRLADALGTPQNVRKQNLGRVKTVDQILRDGSNEIAPTA